MKPKRGEIFQAVEGSKIANRKSSFNLSHSSLVTCNMGKLVPISCIEVNAGETFKLGMSQLTRLAPMLAPVYQNINMYAHFFFVPMRLTWNKWEDFFTGGKDGDLAPAKPFITFNNRYVTDYPLADYLGIPNNISDSIKVDALPFVAYQIIYNEFYRDQNLMNEIELPLDEEGDITESWIDKILALRTRCWAKDYFTSALPFAQRGPEVTADILGYAPISGNVIINQQSNQGAILFSSDRQLSQDAILQTGSFLAPPTQNVRDAVFSDGGKLIDIRGSINSNPLSSNNNLSADLSKVSGISINKLRVLTKLQQYLELKGRGGARYKEQIQMLFGAVVPDYRIQRPEYLGGTKSPIQISNIVQTANNTGENTGVGDLYGYGLSADGGHIFTKYFSEPGYIIGIMSYMPTASYFQGLPRLFSRFDKLDYLVPLFANLGEQEVKNKEIYANHTDPDGVFGYQARYAEYRYLPDEIHGDFRSSLSYWHLGRKFENSPSLNGTFVECNPRTDIFAVQTDVHHIWTMLQFNITAIRPLPRFANPSLL